LFYFLSFGFIYIFLVYVSEWVKAVAASTNVAQVIVNFVKSNIFCEFEVSRVTVID